MAEISEKTWEQLDKIEKNLLPVKLLEKVKAFIAEKSGVDTDKMVNNLLRCFRLLQKEFLVDCLKEPPYEKKTDNERDPKKIKRDIRNAFGLEDNDSVHSHNALVFGTGISMGEPFYLPNWATLLQRIHKSYFIERYGRDIPDADVQNTLGATDLYELAQYLESILSEDNVREYGEEFRTRTYNRLFSMVGAALYSTSPERTERKAFRNSFIGYLARLAKKYKIQRILTYNYDDCFEGAYSTLFPHSQITPVFVDEQLPFSDETKGKRVYHVHGLIPKYYDYSQEFITGKAHKDWLRSAEARHIVLTEDSYDEIAHSNYKWRNTIQADTLVRYNCFIFGFSASDRNFKRLTRLIDWHQNEINGQLISQPVKHYIFLTIDEYLKGIFHESVPTQENSKQSFFDNLLNLQDANGKAYEAENLVGKFQFLYYTLRSKRKYLRRFHIYPIWTTISDLKNRVQSIIKL